MVTLYFYKYNNNDTQMEKDESINSIKHLV